MGPGSGGLGACAAVFVPGEVPREGEVVFWRPGGGALPEGVGRERELTVVRPHGRGVRRQVVAARALSVGEALPVLVRARADRGAHPAAACWGAAALHGLRLVARGRLVPGLGAGDVDVWRAGPLDSEDAEHVRSVAAAMPGEAHAVVPGGTETGRGGALRVPEPEALVRAFLDAVADTLPRTPAAPLAAGAPFAARERQPLAGRFPRVREWATEVAAGLDSGVRISLRLDLSARELFDGGTAEERPEGEGDEERSVAAAVVQATSLSDATMVADVGQLWRGEAEHLGPRAKVDTVLAIRRAARVWAPLGRLLERPVPDVLPLTEDELNDLLGRAARKLADADVAVHWPRTLARELTATAVVGSRSHAPGSSADGFGFFKEESLLEFRWQVALDGDPLTEGEMDELAEAHRPLVRLRDEWVLVDPELVRKARKRHLGLLSPGDALAVALTGEAEVDGEQVEAVPVGALAALRERLHVEAEGAEGSAGAELPPEGLRAELRGYQSRGLAWLDKMASLGLGGCLADDMGLGKTVTLIALHLRRAERARSEGVRTAPTLVVCPASLLGNWQREITRFAPGVPVRRFHGSGRSLEGVEPDAHDAGFVLTTYGTMRTSAGQLASHEWGLAVADEAQHVKNPHSATARALRTIGSSARVALTGTPVENNLSELWALLDWTTPGLLGPLKTFRARHARAVEGGEDPEATGRLARLVRPFLLRRKKSDPGIVPELPPKTETDHPAPLRREQAALYQAVVRETLARIEAAEGIERRGLVMKLLTALKQICNHPAQYLREDAHEVSRRGGRSGKLELLDELLETILAEDGSVLVFTQYVAMARLLEHHLAARGIPTQLLHGGTPLAQREEMVDRFQSGEVPVFLLSLKAAGTGLNLTRAGHVVHYDRWWNPAVEEQATDRAYRIGQTQPVQVHRLLTEGTVEDRIAQLLVAKRQLADAVLSGGEAALTELTNAELADLVSLRRET
ncbi:DEAD/DEAH box helicase [Streptomyces iconiensis]|uniref:DEAD/DEAH box helicase n=1 Tax=Streptomyces iconiensis TaxID=1384038 RepID=A0ABT6ZVR8_9ACTN|nr:DEAD/DEAH box helicase [Streptomyces iconiensis]MDJ1133174.1 DEAD/DEAH box helicase [Streptomyces iconiensis]